MNIDRLNRRVHLYLALFLLPWFGMYGISSLAIHHRSLFRPTLNNKPVWSETLRKPYSLAVPENVDIDVVAATLLAEAGLSGPMRVERPNPRLIEITLQDFWLQTRLVYDLDQSLLTVSEKHLALDEVLVSMHVRSGFQGPLSHDFWAVLIDVVCVGFLAWIASGLYMWWKIRRSRRWGVVALSAGLVTFAVFLSAF